MGDVDIQKYFFSKASITAMQLLGIDKTATPQKLRQFVLEHFSEVEILRSTNIRKSVLQNLYPDNAKELSKLLGITTINEQKMYEKLIETKFLKNSKNEKLLFTFFEINIQEETNSTTENEISKPDTEKIKPEKKLFEHQLKAHDSIIEYLESGKNRCLLHMPTGSGKTTTAMNVVSTIFLRSRPVMVIWLAYNEELCEQAIEEFKKIWKYIGNRDIKLFRFFRNHSPDILKDTSSNKDSFIIASLGKMHNASKKRDVFLNILADRVNFVIMDEAHQALAPTYADILMLLTEKHRKQKKLLGLSATPSRPSSNVAYNVKNLKEFFDGKIVRLNVEGYENPIKYLITEKYIANPTSSIRKFDAKFTQDDLKKITKNNTEFPKEIFDRLDRSEEQILNIIKITIELIKRGHSRIIVFGATVNNSKNIAMILNLLKYKSFHVDGNTTPELREKYINQYRSEGNNTIIMCNFGVFTAGFDAPKTSAVVIARPTKSVVLHSQMAGRAMRGTKVGGTENCEIITLTDIKLGKYTDVVENYQRWEEIWS